MLVSCAALHFFEEMPASSIRSDIHKSFPHSSFVSFYRASVNFRQRFQQACTIQVRRRLRFDESVKFALEINDDCTVINHVPLMIRVGRKQSLLL